MAEVQQEGKIVGECSIFANCPSSGRHDVIVVLTFDLGLLTLLVSAGHPGSM